MDNHNKVSRQTFLIPRGRFSNCKTGGSMKNNGRATDRAALAGLLRRLIKGCAMRSRVRIFIFVFTATSSFAVAHSRPAADKPNVVIFISDDQGYGDMGIHGNNFIHTPRLDRMARDGARLDRFYVSPVCAPTRASLMTGRYHLRTRVSSTSLGHEVMNTEEVTLAEILRDNGYVTGAFGKWHNGHHPPYHPNGQGFDDYLGVCQGHWNNYFNLLMERNGQPYPTHGYTSDVLTDHAMEFIKTNRDKPFFCYVPYNVPHTPFQVPDKYYDKYAAAGLNASDASAYGMCENMDFNVGRVLDQLDALGITKNTIVIYMSDNGPNSGKKTPRFNATMKGRKGSVHEGGVRVPFFIRWPGQIASGQVIDTIASHIDLLPSLVELTGTKMGKTLPQDGVSLVPLINNNNQEPAGWPQRMIFSSQTSPGHQWPVPSLNEDLAKTKISVRTPRYRAVTEHKDAEGKAVWQLYDMQNDPSQKFDVAKKNPRVLANLTAASDAWFADVTRDGYDLLPAPIGGVAHPIINGYETVLLNAQDAQLESRNPKIAWVHRLGNNGWIDNWTTTDFTPSWHIDVRESGKWDVTIHYNAAADAVGTKLRVSAGGEAIEAIITQARVSDPLPRPNRTPMRHYIDKNWATLRVGQLKFEMGADRLRVEAISQTGELVMQLKDIVLTRPQ